MAQDPSVVTYIKTVKSARKFFQDEEAKFYQKFVKENHVPTPADVEKLKKLITTMKTASNIMLQDALEIHQALQGFGGPSDTVFHGINTLLATMEKHVAHH
ncbi:MAG TPA: hypothetical protein VH253_09685 [Phycisphaerae bacterium]|nr:hypothetical protein [Phycisphaerae bacterium]